MSKAAERGEDFVVSMWHLKSAPRNGLSSIGQAMRQEGQVLQQQQQTHTLQQTQDQLRQQMEKEATARTLPESQPGADPRRAPTDARETKTNYAMCKSRSNSNKGSPRTSRTRLSRSRLRTTTTHGSKRILRRPRALWR